ncbi:hypothetical protein HMI55_005764, partial [Coelomomyces lativittatus]
MSSNRFLSPSSSNSITTYSLVFSQNYHPNSNDFQFLELPNELIDEFESGLNSSVLSKPSPFMVFKGNNDEPLTLHTNNATFQVRQVQTSNTYFILQTNSEANEDAEGNDLVWRIPHSNSHYLELIKQSPNMSQLHSILNRLPPFSGHFEDNLPEASSFTFHQLLNEIQSSELELKKELERIHAIQIQGWIYFYQ